MSDKRILYMDFLRVFGTICIITIHVTDLVFQSGEVNSFPWIYANLVQSLVRCGVPLFFMLSGALLLNSKSESLKDFYLKRLSKILIPLIVYSFPYKLLQYKFGLFKIHTILISIREIFAGPSFYHLWFVYSILGLYFIAPFLKTMVQNLDDKMLLKLILLFVLVRAGQIYLPIFNINIGIDLGYINGWSIYFILGYFMTRVKEQRMKNYIYGLGIISYIATFALKYLSYNTEINGISPTMIGLSAAVFMFFIDMRDKLTANEKVNKAVIFISKTSFGIYLIHAFVLIVINDKLHFNAMSINPLLGAPITVIACFIISTMTAFVVDKTIINNIFFIINFFSNRAKRIHMNVDTKSV